MTLAGRFAVDHDDVASEPVAISAALTGDHDGSVFGVAVHVATLEGFAPSWPLCPVFLSRLLACHEAEWVASVAAREYPSSDFEIVDLAGQAHHPVRAHLTC
jgi:hypothetical protein